MRGKVLRGASSIVALLLTCATIASAQVRITGGISGTVVDNTGGVVPGATVQPKDEDEGTGTQSTRCIVNMGGSVV